MSDFNLKLKDVRTKKKLKQSELAEKLNSTQQLVSQYENGLKTPSLDRLVEIAQILDVSLDELVEFKKIHSEYSKFLSSKTKK